MYFRTKLNEMDTARDKLNPRNRFDEGMDLSKFCSRSGIPVVLWIELIEWMDGWMDSRRSPKGT